jgi:hypothetical protein
VTAEELLFAMFGTKQEAFEIAEAVVNDSFHFAHELELAGMSRMQGGKALLADRLIGRTE